LSWQNAGLTYCFPTQKRTENKPMPQTTRYAVVVDDHPLAGRGVAEYLRGHAHIDEVFTVKNAAECLALLSQQGPALLAVIDFWLADGTTADLVSQLRQSAPTTGLLVLSGDDDPQVAALVQNCGAHGFVHKQQPPDVFAQAVNTVIAGGKWFQGVGGALSSSIRELPVTPAELGLSPRQGEILALVLQGMPNKRIAQTLNLSESTVKEHVTGILQKLGATNRVEVITKLRGRRLITAAFSPR
jgi:DNA-binding NarL/FixJ family response regulator